MHHSIGATRVKKYQHGFIGASYREELEDVTTLGLATISTPLFSTVLNNSSTWILYSGCLHLL
jgi:hypothetical protein